MSQLRGVRDSAANIFFFYLLGESGARILGKYCAQKPEHRRDALVEIVDTTLLAANDNADPRYPYAFVSLLHRLARQNYPLLLVGESGIERYVDYLQRVVDPSAEELRQAYQYALRGAWRQAHLDVGRMFRRMVVPKEVV